MKKNNTDVFLKNANNLRKFLVSLRSDNGNESILDMATKLGISESYLSRIERGLRVIPENFYEVIVEKYKLDDKKANELYSNIAKLTTEVKINLKNSSNEKKTVAVNFAKKFSKLKDSDVEEIDNILKRGETVGS